MKKSKIWERILKDKKFMNSAPYALDDLKEEYVDYLMENDYELRPKAKSKTNYIGIEIECFTRYDKLDLMDKLEELGLNKMVQLVEDGSIEPGFGEELEIRVLIPEKKLASGLKKLSKLFVKGKFGVNDSCGLHVHLDMRNRNVNECHKKLLKFQKALFSMVSEDRWNNQFCEYSTDRNKFSRGAINKETAYTKHKTIEVRMHESTLDMNRIEKWVQLLLKVISKDEVPAAKSKEDVLKLVKNDKPLEQYVNKTLNEEYFATANKRGNDMLDVC